MPYKKKRNKDGTFQVINTDTGKVHAKSTSEERAAAQIRLLYAKENEKESLDWDTPTEKADNALRRRNYR